ncbi:hypothetical protein QFC20_004441 [Naganishia adeliensis]|uniref:Uncharacterized protein n=1 Tax=Naganishia adeliensis TaxID=92952 RepID=A0ACC2W1K7_9TREE|nr:hypothetical protein QFC20_004441 [Naganishia adeliensis]
MSPTIPIIDDLGLSRPFRIAIDCTIFLISLYFLERSADVFVDSAAVIGKRFGIPTVLVGLLRAGAEWEERENDGRKERPTPSGARNQQARAGGPEIASASEDALE